MTHNEDIVKQSTNKSLAPAGTCGFFIAWNTNVKDRRKTETVLPGPNTSSRPYSPKTNYRSFYSNTYQKFAAGCYFKSQQLKA